MNATCIETGNNKIERTVFFNLDQFDIHVKVDQTDNNMIHDKCIYYIFVIKYRDFASLI